MDDYGQDTEDLVDGFPRGALLAGPSPFVFSLEDVLEIDSLCSVSGVTLTVSGIMLDGGALLKPFKFTHAPNSNRTLTTTRQAIGSGWLLRVRVTASAGALRLGQCFAWLRTCRGLTSIAEVNGTIASGYVTPNADVFWPGDVDDDPLEGAGALRSITGATPAAGVEISETVPVGARWEVLMFAGILTTSAAAGSRIPTLIIDDGVNELHRSPSVGIAGGSSGVHAYWSQGMAVATQVLAGVSSVGLPVRNRLGAGARLRTTSNALDAADQWSAVQYLVLEWLEGN